MASTPDIIRTVAPTANDDYNDGYRVGDTWSVRVSSELPITSRWICAKDTPGAAVWLELTNTTVGVPGGEGSAPSDAQYVLMVANPDLSSEVLWSSLIGAGDLASRPTTPPTGSLYFVTDTGAKRWTRYSGGAWSDLQPSWEQIAGLPSTFAPSAHTHVIGDTTGLQTALDGKAASVHTHDDRYFTETEVNDALVLKQDLSGKGAANGYAPLDSGLLLPVAHLPNHASSHAPGGADPITIQAAQVSDLAEAVDDRVAALLVQGSGITLSYDDASNQLTITGGGGSSEPGLWNKREAQYLKSPGVATYVNVGLPATPTAKTAGTVATADDADGPWNIWPTTNVNNNAAGLLSAFTLFRRDWEIGFITTIKTDPTLLTLQRIWIGLFSSDPAGLSAPGAAQIAAFRYDTGVHGTAFWRTITASGSANTEKTTTQAIAANTKYLLRILCSNTSPDIKFYINDVLVSTHSNAENLPGATTLLGYGLTITTLSAAVRNLKFGRLAYRHN